MTSKEPTGSRRLLDALHASQGLVVAVTGAGISAASGISTFRGTDPGAVWRQNDVEMATVAMFERDPVAQLSWYLERFAALDDARPNAGHRALVELEAWVTARGGRFLLVTQNIDTLHEQAGSRELIKVHGSSDRLRCGSAGCPLGAPRGSLARSETDLERFRRRPGADRLPRCPECSTPLRPHVLFFDEYYTEHRDYRFSEVEEAATRAEVLLFVGTSFSVGVTSLMLQEGSRRGTPMFSVDPGHTRLPAALPVARLSAPAEEFLPDLVARLVEP